MKTRTILSPDFGRYNSVACWSNPRTRVAEFCTIQTTPEEVRLVLNRKPVSSVVFEACSQAGWVDDLCEAAGLSARVASTTGSAWQWKHVKQKTDRNDALKLARLEAVGEIDPVSSANRQGCGAAAQTAAR